MLPTQDGATRSLFRNDPFNGFGPSRFHAATFVAKGHELKAKRGRDLKPAVRRDAPRTPGVYGMLDRTGRLIYVGKAKSLRTRLLSYFREDSRNPKAGRIINQTRTLLWEENADELAALLRELELIRRFRPRFNVLGQPDNERYLYLCIGREPAPMVYLTREPKDHALAVYGPFLGKGTLLDSVRTLNLHFGLRDCPNNTGFTFADQVDLFENEPTAKCLRYELQTCPAPCAGFCTKSAYQERVRAAKQFLDGHDEQTLSHFTQEMHFAAAALQYEKAATLRDKLAQLTKLQDRLLFLRTARKENSFIYPCTGANKQTLWYLIHGGEVRAVCESPKCSDTALSAKELIQSVFHAKFPGAAVLDRCGDSVLIITSWFRKRAEEKEKLLTAKDALVLCEKRLQRGKQAASPK